MRVLCLTAVPPWPAVDGGRRRTSELLGRAAAQPGVELHLLSLAGPESSTPGPPDLARHEVLEPSPLPPLRAPLAARPERWFHSSALARRVRELLAREPFDLLHLDEPCLLRALPPRTPPLVLHHHKLDLDLARDLGRPWHERLRLARLEGTAVRRGDRHVTSSEEDRARLLARHPRLRAQDLLAIPCGADSARLRSPDPARREPLRLLFLGNLDYAPNRRALDWLLAQGWPAIAARAPGATLAVVGSGRAPELEARAARWNAEGTGAAIDWVGPVPEVRTELARAAALLAPLDVGGGSRVKIVEALAAGCPVISTPVGAAGLPLDGRHLLRVERGTPFVEGALDALLRPASHRQRAERGRAFVAAHLDWGVLTEALLEAWRDAARPRATHPRGASDARRARAADARGPSSGPRARYGARP